MGATGSPRSGPPGASGRSSRSSIQSQAFDRISYLYYMLIVLPGLYLLAAWLFTPSRIGRAATIGWGVALIYSFIDLYPVRSFTGH